MEKFTIEVYRIVRESMPVTVESHNLETAKELAKESAIVQFDSGLWECYDCTYWID